MVHNQSLDNNASNPQGFYVLENFLDEDDCKRFAEYIDLNSEPDPKDFFRFFPIPAYSDDNGSTLTVGPLPWDPERKMQELVDTSETFVRSNFNLWGNLRTDRIHGNIMDKGSQFYYHTDEDPNDLGEYDGAKRTYVGDLFLNDDYDGGDFGFEVEGELIKFKPKAGSLVIFNGYNTIHGIDPVTSGRRINIMSILHDIKS